MRTFINNSALATKLSAEEFKLMIGELKKGVVSFKATKNDNITKLALTMTPLFTLQRNIDKNPMSQALMSKYLQANQLAEECLKIIEPFAKEQEEKRKRLKKGSSDGN